MTIVASVKVYDGIVLGSDSATQIMGRDPQGKIVIFKTYENARKLFQYLDFPIGILSYGIGNIEKKSIETLLLEFERTINIGPYPSIQQLSEALFTFFNKKYHDWIKQIQTQDKHILGFFIAGYSPESPLAEEWEFVFPISDKPKSVRPIDQFGSSWRGVSIPFTRLYFGFDPRLKDKLKDLGVSETIIDQAFKEFGSNVIYDGMPVQDAIKFVEFILKTTIGLAYFEIGPPSCSEPIDIVVIDSKKQFHWISEKKLHL